MTQKFNSDTIVIYILAPVSRRRGRTVNLWDLNDSVNECIDLQRPTSCGCLQTSFSLPSPVHQEIQCIAYVVMRAKGFRRDPLGMSYFKDGATLKKSLSDLFYCLFKLSVRGYSGVCSARLLRLFKG